ncbi:helix-turn-helix domain-containing protein [Kaistia sp. MMO-174]|uniref:helix-turn-helix domain-containing protein n=1 Tax=Kaistia sp. MMO-174 TaxID=3081256 RepID=UPI00301A510C
MKDLRDTQIEWIDAICTAMGWTLTDLARKAGINSSTLTRWKNDAKFAQEGRTLSARTVKAVEDASGVRAYESPANGGRGLAEAEAAPFQGSQNPYLRAYLEAFKGGRNAVDAWVLTTRSLDLIGYMPGDVVLVDLNAKPVAGNVVCAQVYDWTRGRTETVFRIYEPPFLMPSSTDPTFRRPYMIDDNTVIVKGSVITSIRAPAQLAKAS